MNRFLAFGDSYTIGEGVAEDERWPNQLAHSLRAEGVVLDDPEVVARTGWTTGELAAAMDLHAFEPPYALVTLLIGVNNQYRAGQPHEDSGRGDDSTRPARALDSYRQEFRRLLERAIELAGGRPHRVIVVSIPDWGVTPFAHASGRDTATIARELDEYNAVNREIAAALRVRYADVASIAREAGGDADMLVSDGLHPSAAMYRRWLDAIAPPARAALRES